MLLLARTFHAKPDMNFSKMQAVIMFQPSRKRMDALLGASHPTSALNSNAVERTICGAARRTESNGQMFISILAVSTRRSEMETPRPLWERLGELHGHNEKRIYVQEKLLGELAPPEVLDRSGTLLTTANKLMSDSSFAVEWLAEGLALRQKEHWRKLRSACVTALRQICARKGDAAAWVRFESCRDPITIQAPGLKNLPWETSWELPQATGTAGDFHFQSFNLAASDVSFSRQTLRFLDAEQKPASRLVHLARLRGLMSPNGPITGLFETWCAADPSDDKHCVEAGWVPAGYPLRVADQINTGLLIDLVCLDASGNADALTLELHPETSEIVSIRRARVPMELLLRSHPRYHDCLRRILGEQPDQDPVFSVEIEKLRSLMENPSSVRFNPVTALLVLCEFVSTSSLRQAGNNTVAGGHSGARRYLQKLEEFLGTSLINTHVNVRGNLNRSEPTLAAKELAAWGQCFLAGDGPAHE
ncbi:hypothetical protein [Blastopirellula marina]|nr:hypothetical protein [Blastopirellula marina]